MRSQQDDPIRWQRADLTAPGIAGPVSAVVARDIPYLPGGNRFQTLSLYLPDTPEASGLIGLPADALPDLGDPAHSRHLVHIHGGAWRDPELTSASIEPTAAYAFSSFDASSPIAAIASVNYRISQYPAHPTLPYDANRDGHSDSSREAMHPDHVGDVLHALALLRSLGIADRSYVLSGHSCGATLALQAVLLSPDYHGLKGVPDAPGPVAVLGLNGLYDLPALVHGLGGSHAHLSGEYGNLLTYAFGPDEAEWAAASPSRFDPASVAERVRVGLAPSMIMLDQSVDDQLVPMNQRQILETNLRDVDGLQVVPGHRCVGKHAAPWEQGDMFWNSLRDLSAMLRERG